jgi:hypothetical protein
MLLAAAAVSGLGCAGSTKPPPPDDGVGVAAFCGGIGALRCTAGLDCVDDPRDSCDPERGGADCGGICVQPGQAACEAFSRRYINRDPDMCARIRFACEQGHAPFHDACGCGCQPEG